MNMSIDEIRECLSCRKTLGEDVYAPAYVLKQIHSYIENGTIGIDEILEIHQLIIDDLGELSEEIENA